MEMKRVITVPEIIHPLRSAFHMSEFDDAAKVLMDRELALKTKNNELERLRANLVLDKLTLEAELNRLKSEKRRSDDEAEAWKKKFYEFYPRVAQLECDVIELTNSLEGGQGDFVQRRESESGRRPGIGDIIVITDSDDERPIGDAAASLSSKLKRKRDSSCNNEECGNSDDKNTPVDKLKHPQEFSNGTRNSPDNNCFATPSLGVSDVEPARPSIKHNPVFIRGCEVKNEVGTSQSDIMDSMFATLKRKKQNQEWESEVKMLQEFARDDEVCLKAVCALYRQQISKETSMKNPVSSSSRGFSPLNALRGTALAKYLIDGDPQCRLKKTVADVRLHDPKAIVDCRRMAVQQSKQLFDMYKKKEDPFFLPH